MIPLLRIRFFTASLHLPFSIPSPLLLSSSFSPLGRFSSFGCIALKGSPAHLLPRSSAGSVRRGQAPGAGGAAEEQEAGGAQVSHLHPGGFIPLVEVFVKVVVVDVVVIAFSLFLLVRKKSTTQQEHVRGYVSVRISEGLGLNSIP